MQQIICPVDGQPCEPDCPDRFTDRPEGGCLLSMLAEQEGEDRTMPSKILFLSTLVSSATIPLAIKLIQSFII